MVGNLNFFEKLYLTTFSIDVNVPPSRTQKVGFHQLGPLGRVGLVVDMSVCVFVCPLPMRFFLRPLIGPQIT